MTVLCADNNFSTITILSIKFNGMSKTLSKRPESNSCVFRQQFSPHFILGVQCLPTSGYKTVRSFWTEILWALNHFDGTRFDDMFDIRNEIRYSICLSQQSIDFSFFHTIEWFIRREAQNYIEVNSDLSLSSLNCRKNFSTKSSKVNIVLKVLQSFLFWLKFMFGSNVWVFV